MITEREYLGETISTQQSLKDYPHNNKNRDAANRAAEIMMHLNADERALHLDFLEKSLSAHDSGDGVPDGDAKRNRASLKPGGGTTSSGDVKMNKLKKETEELTHLIHVGSDLH